ncbi:ParB/RepB/Spo0J family partition protein [Pseudokineococcus lusitanus]|uniref:ParB/RepB/Spo0J family partition protein n=1 Tax=Pseudokineococcus lusitanus TaxID=763993 RepID=A0A3N1HU38_9ACTN|nr:ParB/RepB/Spo0J family partition protein [Pseudokineococcus lusitanus]ROP45926.1 ParB/RepB/Spo0J family partition protein [Pseudokineococcus lusitanus]
MTAAPAETAPSTHFAEIPAKHLTPHPKNVRVDVGDVTDLAASIKTQGVLQPLVVAPMAPAKGSRSKQQQYVVIAGHRRLAAATTARLTVLPCVVREDLVGEAEQLQAMLVENGQRTDLTPVEEGDAYRALTLDYGVSVKDLAKNIGRSQQLVRGRITLSGSPDSVRTRVIAGQVPIEQAIELASFDGLPEVHDALAKHLGGSSWSWALQDARNARTGAEAFTRDVRDVERSQTRRVEERPDGDVVVTLDDLSEAASEQAFTAVLDAQHEDVPEDEAEQAASAAAAEARAALAVEGHASCPGHCAYIQQGRAGTYTGWQPGYVQYCCDQPVLHANVTGWEAPSRGSDEAAAAAAAREQERQDRERELDAALKLAATLRRAHLADHASALSPAAAITAAVEVIVDKVAGSGRGSVAAFAEILDIELPLPPGYGADLDYTERDRLAKKAAAGQRTALTTALTGRPLPELVALIRVAEWLPEEAGIADTTSRWVWQRAGDYLRALAGMGYTWSPVEEQALPDDVRPAAEEPPTEGAS